MSKNRFTAIMIDDCSLCVQEKMKNFCKLTFGNEVEENDDGLYRVWFLKQYWEFTIFYFRNDADAMLFTLKFGGKLY